MFKVVPTESHFSGSTVLPIVAKSNLDDRICVTLKSATLGALHATGGYFLQTPEDRYVVLPTCYVEAHGGLLLFWGGALPSY